MGRTKYITYECRDCGHEFKGHPDKLVDCKKCKSANTEIKAYRCLGCDSPTYEDAGIVLVKGTFMVCSEACEKKGREVLHDLIHD